MDQELDVVTEDATDQASQAADTADARTTEVVEVVEELLIEEISIDGMCGVY